MPSHAFTFCLFSNAASGPFKILSGFPGPLLSHGLTLAGHDQWAGRRLGGREAKPGGGALLPEPAGSRPEAGGRSSQS